MLLKSPSDESPLIINFITQPLSACAQLNNTLATTRKSNLHQNCVRRARCASAPNVQCSSERTGPVVGINMLSVVCGCPDARAIVCVRVCACTCRWDQHTSHQCGCVQFTLRRCKQNTATHWIRGTYSSKQQL